MIPCLMYALILVGLIVYIVYRDLSYKDIIDEYSSYLIIINNKGKIIKINHFWIRKIWNNYQKKNYKSICHLIDNLVDNNIKKIINIINDNNKINESLLLERKNIIINIKKTNKITIISFNENVVCDKNIRTFLVDDKDIVNLKNNYCNKLPIIEDEQIDSQIFFDNKLDSFNFISKKNSITQRQFCLIFDNFHLSLYQYIWDMYFENSTIPHFITDSVGCIILKNKAVFNSAINNIKDHIDAKNILLTDLIHENSQEVLQSVWQDLKNDKIITTKIKITLNNTGNSLIVMHLQKIDKDLILGSLIDITEQRNLELQFIHSQKMQAIGQLAGGIAHDFNNLLTAMIGFCDILLTKHFPGDESFTYVMHIRQNVNRAANLVKQLLALSRQQVLQSKIFNPYTIIYELSFLIRRLIGESIQLNIIGSENVGNIKFDQGQLEQIIINLAINARDAMKHHGKLTIEINNENINKYNHPSLNMFSPVYDEEMQEGSYISINVIDNGSGIEESDLSKIFEPFFSTKGNTGTGLGLSTVYGIIKQAHGFIFVETKKNHGTKFSIFLKTHENIIHDQSVSETNDSNSLMDTTGNSSILIIEDDDSVRMLMTNVLQNRGYNIIAVNSGLDALKVFDDNNHIDIIISDIIMPDTDGPKVIQEIHDKYTLVKVIFISGYSKQYLTEKNIENKDVYFLQKPFAMQDLIKVIKNVESEL